MQSQAANGEELKPTPEDPQNGHHDALIKDLVYEELFSEMAPSPARHTNGNSKRSKPGPLSKKNLKLEKARDAPKPKEAETTNGHSHQQIDPPVNSHPINEQTDQIQINDNQINTVEFLPTELCQPAPKEAFPEYLPAEAPSFQDDSFASTELFEPDESVAQIEVCVSPSALTLDASQESITATTPFPDPPMEIIEPDDKASIATPVVPTPREYKETPREYRSFLSVSGRPSLRNATPASAATTSTPPPYFSFLRGGRNADDPPTPYPSCFAVKRKAESPVEAAEVKRVKPVEEGFFSRVTAPLFRRFAAKDPPGEEDEGIDEGVAEEAELALATAEPAGRNCVVM